MATLPYSLVTTVGSLPLVLMVWVSAYSSYFTSTIDMSFTLPQPDEGKSSWESRTIMGLLWLLLASMCLVCVHWCTHAHLCTWVSRAHWSAWPGCSFSNRSHQSCEESIKTWPFLYYLLVFLDIVYHGHMLHVCKKVLTFNLQCISCSLFILCCVPFCLSTLSCTLCVKSAKQLYYYLLLKNKSKYNKKGKKWQCNVWYE